MSTRRKPASDADLILDTYLRRPRDFLTKVKGIFTLALWDAADETLLVARDPLGVYPALYARCEDDLLVSTTATALLEQTDVPRSVDRLVTVGHLAGVWPVPERTYFEGIRRVLPGHLLRIRGREETAYRYWEPRTDVVAEGSSDEEVWESFRHLLKQAVLRFSTMGPLGVALSGGLDSATIAIAANEVTRTSGDSRPLALSLVYSDPDCNEEDRQRGIAAALRLPQVTLPAETAAGAGGLLEATLEACRDYEFPASYWQPAWDALAREGRHRGCRVVLTGEGGDEWLGTAPQYAADSLYRLDARALFRQWRARHGYFPVSRVSALHSVLWKWGARPLARALIHQWFRGPLAHPIDRRRRTHLAERLPAWLAPDRDLRQELIERTVDSLRTPRPGNVHGDKRRELLDHVAFVYMMEGSFSLRRRVGVRLLHPFFDADLVEFLYSVPPGILNRAEEKWLARRVVVSSLPPSLSERSRTVYFDSACRSVLADEGPGIWRRRGSVRCLSDLGVVDEQAFRESVESALASGSLGEAATTWEAVNVDHWLGCRIASEG